MRWRAKYTKVDPEVGVTREKRVFAWTPVYINGEWVWLEKYAILQGFATKAEYFFINGKKTLFALSGWEDISKRTID